MKMLSPKKDDVFKQQRIELEWKFIQIKNCILSKATADAKA